MRHRLSFLSLVGILVLTAVSVRPAQAGQTLRMGYDHNNDHPTAKSIILFADLVKKYTNGAYTVRLFPSGQLGDERKMLEQVQNRMLDLTKTALVLMTTYNDLYSVLVMPYMFDGPEHFRKVVHSPLAEELKNSTAGKGLVGLTFLYDEPRSYYTVSKAVRTPEDLKGLKIRVMNTADAIAVAKALGATPTPLSWGEVYTALQQGVVDGAEGGPSALTLAKHGEVTKSFSNTKHVLYPGLFVIGRHVWDKLSPENKAAFQRAADEAAEFQMKEFLELEAQALKDMVGMGVTITEPELAPFRERAAAYWKETATPAQSEIIKRIAELN